MTEQIRKGLPKLEDFPNATHLSMLHFWDIYDKSKAFQGDKTKAENFNTNIAKWNAVHNRNLSKEIEDTCSEKHGIYIIIDTQIADGQTIKPTKNSRYVPIENVIYVGQAGAESKAKNSSFHERIYKHALVAMGCHDGKWGDTSEVENTGMADSEYWRDYRLKRELCWNRGQFPIDDWWISLIVMPCKNSKDKIAIKRLEDILMLGVSSLCRPDRQALNNAFSKTLPFCNKQFGFGVLDEIYKHGWKMKTGKKKPGKN